MLDVLVLADDVERNDLSFLTHKNEKKEAPYEDVLVFAQHAPFSDLHNILQ